MAYQISNVEKTILISCLNSRLQEYENDTELNILYKYDFADWAENLKTPYARRIDSVNKLLVKLGHKKSSVLFEDIVSLIGELKRCKDFLLIGKDDDYYRIIAIVDNSKTATIELKANVSFTGSSKLKWIPRTRKWIELECSQALGKRVNKKQAWKLISNCSYRLGSKPTDKMMRFLRVILK